jgi:hypothetical protein
LVLPNEIKEIKNSIQMFNAKVSLTTGGMHGKALRVNFLIACANSGKVSFLFKDQGLMFGK